jgi:hypothetical protein
VILPNSTPQQQQIFHSLFTPHRASWAHWSSEVWLLHFPNEDPLVEPLRDEIQRALPGVQVLILKIDGVPQFAGWGTKAWQDWLDKFWTGP